jgi:hypothetical protein
VGVLGLSFPRIALGYGNSLGPGNATPEVMYGSSRLLTDWPDPDNEIVALVLLVSQRSSLTSGLLDFPNCCIVPNR